MDNKDLRLGDWVRTEAGVMQVSLIAEKMIYCSVPGGNKSWDITTVEPIPITEEILVKNGFEHRKHDGGSDEYVMYDDYNDITIDEWSDSIWRIRHESTEMNIPHEQILCSYVNELQHFLNHYLEIKL